MIRNVLVTLSISAAIITAAVGLHCLVTEELGYDNDRFYSVVTIRRNASNPEEMRYIQLAEDTDYARSLGTSYIYNIRSDMGIYCEDFINGELIDHYLNVIESNDDPYVGYALRYSAHCRILRSFSLRLEPGTEGLNLTMHSDPPNDIRSDLLDFSAAIVNIDGEMFELDVFSLNRILNSRGSNATLVDLKGCALVEQYLELYCSANNHIQSRLLLQYTLFDEDGNIYLFLSVKNRQNHYTWH